MRKLNLWNSQDLMSVVFLIKLPGIFNCWWNTIDIHNFEIVACQTILYGLNAKQFGFMLPIEILWGNLLEDVVEINFFLNPNST